MSALESLPVQIGQVKVGRAGQSLNAILGSCVGLGFLYSQGQVYGLAHALLAKSKGENNKGDGRHVDQAIVSLLEMMEVPDDHRRKVKVFIAGGANMTLPSDADPKRMVGTVNANFARRALREAGLRLHYEDTGGEQGRRVEIDCDTGEYTIKTIPRLGAV